MTERKNLTAAQDRVLRVLHAWTSEHGYPPSVRELALQAGLASTSTVVHHLEILARKGYITRVSGQARAICVRLPGEGRAA